MGSSVVAGFVLIAGSGRRAAVGRSGPCRRSRELGARRLSGSGASPAGWGCGARQPNMRLKLTPPVVGGRIPFVNRSVWRRSLAAIR